MRLFCGRGRMRAEDLRFVVVKNDKINWKRDRKMVAKIAWKSETKQRRMSKAMPFKEANAFENWPIFFGDSGKEPAEFHCSQRNCQAIFSINAEKSAIERGSNGDNLVFAVKHRSWERERVVYFCFSSSFVVMGKKYKCCLVIINRLRYDYYENSTVPISENVKYADAGQRFSRRKLTSE